jgi:hypothetical protein
MDLLARDGSVFDALGHHVHFAGTECDDAIGSVQVRTEAGRCDCNMPIR